jgi:hypothetical protein
MPFTTPRPYKTLDGVVLEENLRVEDLPAPTDKGTLGVGPGADAFARAGATSHGLPEKVDKVGIGILCRF